MVHKLEFGGRRRKSQLLFKTGSCYHHLFLNIQDSFGVIHVNTLDLFRPNH